MLVCVWRVRSQCIARSARKVGSITRASAPWRRRRRSTAHGSQLEYSSCARARACARCCCALVLRASTAASYFATGILRCTSTRACRSAQQHRSRDRERETETRTDGRRQADRGMQKACRRMHACAIGTKTIEFKLMITKRYIFYAQTRALAHSAHNQDAGRFAAPRHKRRRGTKHKQTVQCHVGKVGWSLLLLQQGLLDADPHRCSSSGGGRRVQKCVIRSFG